MFSTLEEVKCNPSTITCNHAIYGIYAAVSVYRNIIHHRIICTPLLSHHTGPSFPSYTNPTTFLPTFRGGGTTT